MATRKRSTAASVPTPNAARWTVGIGGTVSLGAAAAISFETLVRLADRLGITPGYLLPAAIDVYAATATLASLLLPSVHPARGTAMWNARGGLAMSVLANAVYHGLVLGSLGGTDLVLIFISAWPPLIVERLLHLQGRLALTVSAPADSAAPAPRTAPATRRTAPESAPVRTGPAAPGSAPAGPAPAAPAAAAARTAPEPGGAVTDIGERTAERTNILLDLMLTHGRENVSASMAAAALGGVARSNGTRALQRLRERPDFEQLLAQRARDRATRDDEDEREGAA